MAYEKRVCVLKQVKKGFTADGGALSGAVYAERLGSELTVTPRIMGIAPVREGKYVLALYAGGEKFFFTLKGNESLHLERAPSVKEGFSVLICHVRGEAEPVAYGRCGVAAGVEELLAAFKADPGKRKTIPNPLPPNELPVPMPNVPTAPTVPLPNIPDEEGESEDRASFRRKYNDEAIAASDYYAADEDENAAASQKDGAGKKTDGRGAEKDDGAVHPFGRADGTLTYYNSVRERIEEAFFKFPKDERLNAAFPHSEWVNGDGALLGVIYGEGRPRYLCVAVEKKGDPPKDMAEHCSFVPASPFTEEEGFYVVFQDADTGAYVTVSQS